MDALDLRLFNTLSGAKAPFVPLDAGRVRMYVCGPTVYDFAHIGNARPAVVFDVLFRLLRRRFGESAVVYVRNVTDVDDKIIAASKRTGEPIAALTERTAAIYRRDVAALGCLPPTEEPRATAHIPEMLAMIGRLVAAGSAYAADGHVLFDVAAFAEYGRLSRRSLDEMIAGARVEVAPYKRNPFDFVLWKPAVDDEPGWDSPWGRGRPGWHIECSAMSARYLGEVFDIHGGGADLIFPHHENEIAQSRCAHGTEVMARVWLHNGFLMTEGEKMSKSLGNFYTIHDLLADHPGEAVRLTLLQTHYRQPLDFTKDAIGRSKRTLDRFYLALRDGSDGAAADAAAPAGEVAAAVAEALCDDLNTPLALARLHEGLTALNAAPAGTARTAARRDLLDAAGLLGLLAAEPAVWLTGAGVPGDDGGQASAAAIEALIEERKAARKAKDFARADAIRADLAAQGVVLEDKPGGVTAWRRE